MAEYMKWVLSRKGAQVPTSEGARNWRTPIHTRQGKLKNG